MHTRPEVLAFVPAAAMLAVPSATVKAEPPSTPCFCIQRIPLEEGWLFRLDPEGRAEAAALTTLQTFGHL